MDRGIAWENQSPRQREARLVVRKERSRMERKKAPGKISVISLVVIGLTGFFLLVGFVRWFQKSIEVAVQHIFDEQREKGETWARV